MRGLWFEMVPDRMVILPGGVVFPSPCGVCGLKFNAHLRRYLAMAEVSVPLRGVWFEIDNKTLDNRRDTK